MDNLELSLVCVTDKITGKKQYFGVNDKHYDAMLATGGSVLDTLYEWDWLGEVIIQEDILKESGLKWIEEN